MSPLGPGLILDAVVQGHPRSDSIERELATVHRPYEVERMDHRCLVDTPNEELPSSRFRKAKVYVDCNSFGPHAIEAAVSLYRADRIVCGTDGTEFGCDWTREAPAEAQIGEEAREQILHGNAAAMLARVG
jgi:predicted TIM-barrel fold metal-dependent hydrolase